MLNPKDHIEVDLGPGITALFTSRRGGHSKGPWRGLNLSDAVGDDRAAVSANRESLAKTVGAPLQSMVQVHGPNVALAEGPIPAAPAPEVDGLITRDTQRALMVLVADCVPVLLADSRARVVAAVHAGRRGVAGGIVPNTVEEMSVLGATPSQTQAVIGPAICGSCYEVPALMRQEVSKRVPHSWSETSWGTPALDLPGAVAAQLRGAGVERVRQVGVCTLEDSAFYSYRDSATTGRTAGVIRLKDE